MAGWSDAAQRFGDPQLIRPRLGQGAFRVLVTDMYDRRCVVSEERTLPALDAAHIRPYGEGGSHEASNGLLLRRDIHSLFDAGYVTVTPDLRFAVSRLSARSSRTAATTTRSMAAAYRRRVTCGISRIGRRWPGTTMSDSRVDRPSPSQVWCRGSATIRE